MSAATIMDTALSTTQITDALRRCGSAKVIAQAIQCSHRTAEDYLQGRREPRFRQTLRLMAAFDEFKAAVLEATETNRDTHANHISSGSYSGPDRRGPRAS